MVHQPYEPLRKQLIAIFNVLEQVISMDD